MAKQKVLLLLVACSVAVALFFHYSILVTASPSNIGSSVGIAHVADVNFYGASPSIPLLYPTYITLPPIIVHDPASFGFLPLLIKAPEGYLFLGSIFVGSFCIIQIGLEHERRKHHKLRRAADRLFA